MKVETVRGPISPDALGITLMHEHVLSDVTVSYHEPKDKRLTDRLGLRRVSLENIGFLRRGPHFSIDNLRLDDEALAVKELSEYYRNGGRTIVDQTLDGIGRNPTSLRRISEETGLNIITTCGWYRFASHPTLIRKVDVEILSEILVVELTEGIGRTNIKAGMIGECAASHNLNRAAPWWHDDEKKVHRAAARAQRKTGAGFTYHIGPWKDTYEPYLSLIIKEDADLRKFMISHADYNLKTGYLQKVADMGPTLSFDLFGLEYYFDYYFKAKSDWFGYEAGASYMGRDKLIVRTVTELCKLGLDRNIVISQDVYLKTALKAFGGWGYSHILENIIPLLRHSGVTKKQVRNMLVSNPKNILAR